MFLLRIELSKRVRMNNVAIIKNYEDASIVLYLRLTEVITECGLVGFKYCISCL